MKSFSLNQPTGLIQSVITDDSESSVCVCVCHHRNPGSWWTGEFGSKSLLIKLAYLKTFLCFCCFVAFVHFDILLGFWVFTNQPHMHNGGGGWQGEGL